MLDEDLQQFFEGRFVLGFGLTALQLFIETEAERPEKTREDRLNQRLLRSEVIVHRRQIDTGLAGDQTQRGFSETFFREQLLGSIENAFNGFRLGHGYSA